MEPSTSLETKSSSDNHKIPGILWNPKVHCHLHNSPQPFPTLLNCKLYAYICTYKLSVLMLHEIRKRKANWIGHILRRNCLLQRVIEGKIKGGIEVTGRRERRRRKLLDNLKERR